MTQPETTNFRKFQSSNWLVGRLIDGFYHRIRDAYEACQPVGSLLDAGCGEAMTLQQLAGRLPPEVTGFDLNPECVAFSQSLFPEAHLSCEDIYQLPYADASFDLTLCLEVLEHLEDPTAGLRSLKRVSRGPLILSVPYEPWFRLGSLCRGKYLARLGNHPEHINHWNQRTFAAFLETEFPRVRVGVAFPWLVAEVHKAPPKP